MSIVAMQVLEQVAHDELQRAARFQARWEAYYGRHPKPLKTLAGKSDDNVIVNYVRVIADKGVSFLFGEPPRFEIDEAKGSEAETWLKEAWTANRQAIMLQKLALNGAVCGHTFVKILERKPYPRLVVLDPATVSVFWEPDDIEAVYRYRIQFPAIDRDGQPVVLRQNIERDGPRWRITDLRARANRDFVETGQAVWPYEFPPVVDCQNLPAANEYWGASDLEDDVLQLNYAINRVLSNIARILRFHAHPKTWGRGFSAVQMQTAIDGTLVFNSPDAELHNLEMVSDLSSSLMLYQRLREALHEISQVPEVATGKLVDNTGSLSGVALSILYRPLLEKTQTKRGLYGELLTEINRRLLTLGGHGEEQRTTLHWPELLPSDPLMERQVAMIDTQLGVSSDTLLQRLGYDPQVEAEKRLVESDEQDEREARSYARGGIGDNGRAAASA